MVAGDVVNVAARLQAAASPNGVIVGVQTHRATAEVFDFREVAPVVAKREAGANPGVGGAEGTVAVRRRCDAARLDAARRSQA